MSIVDHETSEISMRVKLSRKAKEKLAAMAAEHGQQIDEYASELLEQAVTRPSLDELLAPVRQQVAQSGMSDEELDDFFRAEIEAVRRERRDTNQ